jgi:hypothetical protein
LEERRFCLLLVTPFYLGGYQLIAQINHNKMFWEELIAYNTDRIEDQKNVGRGHTDTQNGDLRSLLTKIWVGKHRQRGRQ